MEGSWVGDKTEESFEVCGYNELAEKYQVKLIDAQKEPAVTMDCGGLELHICRCATEVDYMINVPVMKGCLLYTSCIQNLWTKHQLPVVDLSLYFFNVFWRKLFFHNRSSSLPE